MKAKERWSLLREKEKGKKWIVANNCPKE